MSRLILLAPMVALLAGCPGNRRPDPPPVPKIVEVTVTKFVPVPADLTADCTNEAAREQTYAEAKRLALKRDEYLAECSARMKRIRALGK